jgi:hypothetical protein
MRLLSIPAKPKRLPDAPFDLQLTDGVPASWKLWIRDGVYWNAELEKD